MEKGIDNGLILWYDVFSQMNVCAKRCAYNHTAQTIP